MGKFNCDFKTSSMYFLLFALVPLVAGSQYPPVHPLGAGTGNDKYNPVDPSYSTPDEVYKAGDKDDCHPVEEIVYDEKCIPYMEKTCYTQQREQCKEVYEKNCTAVIDEFEERECFDVTELMCSLAESIQYVDIEYQYCWDEDKVVKDRTCVFSVDFDCKKKKPYDGQGAVQCEKTPTKKCYDTPRKVQEEICKPQTSKYCEKFTNDFPYPVGKQNCHTEPMKKCELESRTRPKKAKKYLYNKECKPVTRQVCENREGKKLRPVCDKIQKNIFSYKPVEQCKEEEKKYCFKVEKKVWKKVCTPEKKLVVDDTFSYV